jgi:hypothetical protein
MIGELIVLPTVVGVCSLFSLAPSVVFALLLHLPIFTHTCPSISLPTTNHICQLKINRVGLSMCQALRVNWTKQRYIEIMLNDWPKMQGIYLQHFIGGALCLPAVLGYTDSWAANLACLGVLSEMGW